MPAGWRCCFLVLCLGGAACASEQRTNAFSPLVTWKGHSKVSQESQQLGQQDSTFVGFWWRAADQDTRQQELQLTRRQLRGGYGYGYDNNRGRRHEIGPGSTPGYGGGPYCRHGQATSVAPYGLASANRCGAFSASTYPVLDPFLYPGIGRKLRQYRQYPAEGGISIVNSNPVSVSNPVTVINPNINKNTNFGGGGLLGLLG